LQVEGQLVTSITTQYDNESAIIGSNLAYAAIHQLGGQAGKGKRVAIPARPYLKLTEVEYKEIINSASSYLR
jgi:phage virion morphogenesis protein